MEGKDAEEQKTMIRKTGGSRDEFRPRQTRQLPRAADLKGRLLSCQSY